MTLSGGAWDDARLDAAFVARAARVPSTPPDLALAVRARLAAAPGRSTTGFGRLAPILGLGAAIAVTVAVGVGQLNRADPAASADPGASATTNRIGAPLSVREAVAIRDGGANDREIAVTGFLAGYSFLGCPFDQRPQNPARLGCPAFARWLLDAPEVLETTSGTTTTGHPPIGASIQPSFAISGFPSINEGGPERPRMTLIGHFDDRRAALCESNERDGCANTFVVDRIAAVDGRDVPVTTDLRNTRYDEATVTDVALDPATSEAAADRVVEAALPDVAILSRQLLTGDRVAAAEPGLAANSTWTAQRLVWVITALGVREGAPVSRTFLVADRTAALVEMTAEGPIRVVAPASSPAPTPSPSAATSVGDELLAHPITVSEAIARRDANLDDTELAVVGFAWYPSAMLSCLVGNEIPAAFRGCQRRDTWLAESDQTSANIISPQPAGPAFNLFVQPETVGAALPQREPTHVIVLGHFDDHRAAACPADQVEGCRKNFIVDVIVDAARPDLHRTWVKVDENAGIRMSVNDAIGFAGLDIGDRSIVAAFAIRTKALLEFEPGAAGASELSGVNSVWIIRWVDRGDPFRPIVRTRLVAEDGPDRLGIGSYEVTATGLEPVAPPSPTDEAFETAPAQVSGLHVMDVRTAIERQSLLIRSEVAVRGWYVPPDPRLTCTGRDPVIHSAQPLCPEAVHWLLEQSELWPAVSTDVRPTGVFLNPIVPSDVPMPIPDIWADGTPEPWPVVIVGHFQDYRVTKYVGASPFIVDALVWQRDGAVTDGSSVTRLTPDAIESPEAAIARIEDELSPPDVSNRELGPPVMTWTSVVSADQFRILEPEISEAAPEFLEARAIWIVRRLVSDRWDGQDRLIVDTAYTADGGSRVWLHRADFGDADLETTLDIGPFGQKTREIKLFDYAQRVVAVRGATAADHLAWRKTGPSRDGLLEIARGATDREVAIRWTGGDCDLDWEIRVDGGAGPDEPGPLVEIRTFGDCYPEHPVPRSIVITFDRPIDLDTVRTPPPNPSGG